MSSESSIILRTNSHGKFLQTFESIVLLECDTFMYDDVIGTLRRTYFKMS